MKRRQFVGYIGNTSLFLLAAKLPLYANESKRPASEEFLFVEAEQFAKHGGWELDQQSMEQMGSPYLLAHGLGIPVQDATTEAELWAAVVDAYKKNKLSEDVALQQAQVARICHASDFNFNTGKVTLWNPTMLTQ